MSAGAAVLERAAERLGFPGSAYVLALAGGTGVGKSSLLNALAGRVVSPARAIRPTTAEPVAWVADVRRDELAPMLDWLGASHVVGHAERTLEHVAVLDLPDFDSVEVAHRATVESLLPRVDALAWVIDPEKYDDARLHDGYLRPLARHAGRFLFVLNKADRLTDGQREEVRDDLARRLADDGIAGAPIFVVSARDGAGELDRLRERLAGDADAKAVVAGKVLADARQAARQLAAQAALEQPDAGSPLIPDRRRAEVVAEATAGALDTIDLVGVRRQAERAVRERARRRGAGLLGRLLSLVHRASGRERRVGDPVGYLRAWRSRGTLARAANPVRRLAGEAALAVPPAWRPRVMELAAAGRVEGTVAEALDQAVAAETQAPGARPPGSLLWPIIGFLQLAATALLGLGALWYVTLLLSPGIPVSTAELPVLGVVPMPLLLLVGGLAGSYLLSVLLHAHAAAVGRRWARSMSAAVRDSVARAIDERVMRPLDDLQAARDQLRATLERLALSCRDDD